MTRVALLFVIAATWLLGGLAAPASAQTAIGVIQACNDTARVESEAAFLRLHALSRIDPGAVTKDELAAAAASYLAQSEACYRELFGQPGTEIDDGGVWMTPTGALAHSPFNTGGTKWGAGTSFPGGQDIPGPGIAGGTVTYSYMGNGISLAGEGGAPGLSVAITSLPTFLPCFLTEFTTAFAAWSSVSNIQFAEVADNGVPFNAPGATGDIRIAGHTFDGVFGVLAHQFFPPPNGVSAAGDGHFDAAEPWSCTAGPGVIDIGIVAIHEIGHGIGLGHEPLTGNVAIMNPFYAPAVASVPLADDIAGASSIYGPGAAAGMGDEVVMDLAAAGLLGLYNNGPTAPVPPLTDTPPKRVFPLDTTSGSLESEDFFALIHPGSPEEMATGDIDANGLVDLIADFLGFGVWVWSNNAGWFLIHPLNVTSLATGDLDGNGQADVIAHFPGFGVWAFFNGTTWVQLHPFLAAEIVTGDLDGNGQAEVLVHFPGFGVWLFVNNAFWVPLHPLAPSQMMIANLDGVNGDEAIMAFPGLGIWVLLNQTTFFQLHPQDPTRFTSGDIDGGGIADAIVDLPGAGIWALLNGVLWVPLHPSPTEDMVTADIDGNGMADLIVDFGPLGV